MNFICLFIYFTLQSDWYLLAAAYQNKKLFTETCKKRQEN